jgi:hypothetical protein
VVGGLLARRPPPRLPPFVSPRTRRRSLGRLWPRVGVDVPVPEQAWRWRGWVSNSASRLRAFGWVCVLFGFGCAPVRLPPAVLEDEGAGGTPSFLPRFGGQRHDRRCAVLCCRDIRCVLRWGGCSRALLAWRSRPRGGSAARWLARRAAASAGGSCSDLRCRVHLHRRLRYSLRPCPCLLLLGRKLHGAEDGGRHVEGPWGDLVTWTESGLERFPLVSRHGDRPHADREFELCSCLVPCPALARGRAGGLRPLRPTLGDLEILAAMVCAPPRELQVDVELLQLPQERLCSWLHRPPLRVVPRCRLRPSGEPGLEADFRGPFLAGWLASAPFVAG